MADGQVTQLLQRMSRGEKDAADELFSLLFADLKVAAEQVISSGGWSPAHHHATQLVCDAYQRLLENDAVDAVNRRQFFFIYQRAMKQTIIDEYRKNRAAKRGGGMGRVDLIELSVDGEVTRSGLADLEAALDELRTIDPDGCRVVELRAFVGLSLEQCVEVLGCSLAKVRGDWSYAMAWLRRRLSTNSQ